MGVIFDNGAFILETEDQSRMVWYPDGSISVGKLTGTVYTFEDVNDFINDFETRHQAPVSIGQVESAFSAPAGREILVQIRELAANELLRMDSAESFEDFDDEDEDKEHNDEEPASEMDEGPRPEEDEGPLEAEEVMSDNLEDAIEDRNRVLAEEFEKDEGEQNQERIKRHQDNVKRLRAEQEAQ